jgi:hypothetical protein
LLITALLSTAVYAANISYSFVLSTTGDNPYGLYSGDIVTVEITYNDENGYKDEDGIYSMHTSNSENIIIEGIAYNAYDADFSLSLALGDEIYTHAADSTSWPLVTFLISDWSIDAIEFATTENGSAISIGIDTTTNTIALSVVDDLNGNWSITGSPVPVPGTITLLGIGLFSLVALSRKRVLK